MKRSGIALLCMTLWWVVPFFVINLITNPLHLHFRSHLLFITIIFLSAIFSMVLSVFDRKRDLWGRYGYWRKYLLLCGMYFLQNVATLIILLTLDAWYVLGYFGGDAEGSIGMLLIPSVIIYLLIGAIAGGITELIKRSGEHRSRGVFV